MRLYDDPVLYDVLHTPGTAQEARALLRAFGAETERALDGFTVLEPACGTGRLLRWFARAGARTIGFDASAAMIDYARLRLPSSELFVADMRSFASYLPHARVDLAFSTINTIRHLESDDELLAHLRQLRRVLKPTGRYLVGLSLVDYEHDEISEDVWEAARGQLRVQQVVQYLPPSRTTRAERVLSHLRVRRPSGQMVWDESYRLRAYDYEQWSELVARSSLALSAVYDMNGRKLAHPDPRYSIFALKIA